MDALWPLQRNRGLVMGDSGGPSYDQIYRPDREAVKDGTQAIADALEVKDDDVIPFIMFGGVPVYSDKNAPPGSVWLTGDGVSYVYDGTEWRKPA